MNRLHTTRMAARRALRTALHRTPVHLINWLGGTLFVALFFTMLHIASLDQERLAIQDALDARAASESRLMRAARSVCADAYPGRATEPVFELDGSLRCERLAADTVAYGSAK